MRLDLMIQALERDAEWQQELGMEYPSICRGSYGPNNHPMTDRMDVPELCSHCFMGALQAFIPGDGRVGGRLDDVERACKFYNISKAVFELLIDWNDNQFRFNDTATLLANLPDTERFDIWYSLCASGVLKEMVKITLEESNRQRAVYNLRPIKLLHHDETEVTNGQA